MNTEMYTLLSLAARYFFAGLMVLIVFRAWRVTVKDNRRARVLRELSPETGCVGEFLVNPKNKQRKTLPIPREGVLGSGRKADIRVKYKGVLSSHAYIEERQGGLLIRPLGRGKVALGKQAVTAEQLFAQDGDVLTIGNVKLLIVLFDPTSQRADAFDTTQNEPEQTEPDDFFDEDKLWQNEGN